ncbi:MAG: glycoside hydrolase family 55 protein, partial [Victivallales bacterium]|nr:glycoside hydrolase family 55 protein [Victivallales bacterium]
ITLKQDFKSADWKAVEIDLTALSSQWNMYYPKLRFDFGDKKGKDIAIRNIQLRPYSKPEWKQAEIRKQIKMKKTEKLRKIELNKKLSVLKNINSNLPSVLAKIKKIESQVSIVKKADEDMGLWLEQQCFILNKIYLNIKTDIEEDSYKSVIIAKSEVGDATYMIKRINEEITYILSEKPPISEKRVNVRDFGAKGDGKTDDSKAIHEAIKFAKEKGINRVFIPKGRYFFAKTANTSIVSSEMQEPVYPIIGDEKAFNGKKPKARYLGHSSHLILFRLNNFILEGEDGSELLFGDTDPSKHRSGIEVWFCENLTIKNLIVDYDPLPFTQGTVVNVVDKGSYDIKIDDGFDPPTKKYFITHMSPA